MDGDEMDGRSNQPSYPCWWKSWFPVPPDGTGRSGGDGAAPSSKPAAAAAQPDEIQQLSDAVRRALECPVCKELSGAMSTCCDNGHGLCDDCSYTMNRLHPKTPPKCPLCRSPPARPDEDGGDGAPAGAAQDPFWEFAYGTSRPPVPASARKLQECMSAIKVTCAYRPNGCPVLVYVLSAAAHESLCPHAPHVRCMVAYCPWSGGYDDVFQHVAAEHQFSAYDLMANEFRMPDLSFGLQGSMRRAYLTRNIRDGGRLYWVCVAQPTVDGLQVAVLKVFDPDTTMKYTSKPPNMVFRVRTMSRTGWPRQRGRSRSVCWDRTMLDRMSGILADSKYRERGLNTLYTPPWCTAYVRKEMQYEASISWSPVNL